MTQYPTKSWDSYEVDIKLLGEYRYHGKARDLDFLRSLAFVHADRDELTERGARYFTSKNIRGADDDADLLLREALRELPSGTAMLQLLAGLGSVPRSRAETALRSQRLTDGLSTRSLGGLLALLNKVALIRYSKGDSTIEILSKPQSSTRPPRSIFIAPETPFSNRIWLRRVLEQCQGYIYWLDKHFLAGGFEPLWEAADRSRINEIRILSLRLDDNSGRNARRAYRDLREELLGRDIALEWRFVDSTTIRPTHDRWIIGRNVARNVPDVGSVLAGKHSELNLSEQGDALRRLFVRYWELAAPMEGRGEATAA
jgi:hypothetical protein